MPEVVVQATKTKPVQPSPPQLLDPPPFDPNLLPNPSIKYSGPSIWDRIRGALCQDSSSSALQDIANSVGDAGTAADNSTTIIKAAAAGVGASSLAQDLQIRCARAQHVPLQSTPLRSTKPSAVHRTQVPSPPDAPGDTLARR
jgi:DNA-binding transcriptional LysR family regulator